MPRPTVISLYTGAGGLDYGFEAAGFCTAVALDLDHDACETVRRNRDWPIVERDVGKVSSREILDIAGLKKGEPAILIGGPPCQPFSKSGYWASGDAKRLGDPRANTLAAYLRVLEDTLPHALLLENVDALSYTKKSEGLQFLIDEIRAINKRTQSNYRPVFQVMRAADYGVPQLRERFIMVACREGTSFTFPSRTHGSAEDVRSQLQLAPLEPYHTAWDALADVQPSERDDVAVHGKWADLLPSIPEGQNYLWHTDRGGGRPLFGWRRRYWSFLLKLAKNRPSWTIQAQPGPATGPFHWENRRLSRRELCRLQTFPDDVEIYGSRMSVQRQVGNAVPSLLAEVLARSIGTQLLGLKASDAKPRLLPSRRTPVPAPEPVAEVPVQFLGFEERHTPHPGTGKGFRARGYRDTPQPVA